MRTLHAWSLPFLCMAALSCDDEDGTQLDGTDAGDTAGTGGAGGSGGEGGSAMTGGSGGQAGAAQAGEGGGAGAAPDAGGGGDLVVALEPLVTGLVSPVVMQSPDETGRFFIADRVGTIRLVGADGQLQAEPFLDISDRLVALGEDYDERGLLGLAFHPEYAQNGRFFVYYSAPLRAGGTEGYNHTSNISEFQVSDADPDAADAASERIVLQIDQPQSNHNGGQIVFGPDGYLYIPLGDGGAADDVGLGHVEDWYETNEGGNGQDLEQSLLGKILRIDVDAGEPYAIPADNPFAGSAMPEIWAYGFRNPFRMAFDRGGSNQLFVGDVGQNLWEEVSIVTAGGNYGWNVKEGTRCFSTASPSVSLAECPTEDPTGTPLTDPIVEYPHPDQGGAISGLSVIGGHVYRGSAIPALQGRYVFGDWSTSFGSADGRLLVASPPAGSGQPWSLSPLAISNRDGGVLGEYVLAFAEDTDGEIYVLTTEAGGPSGSTGKVYRLAP